MLLAHHTLADDDLAIPTKREVNAVDSQMSVLRHDCQWHEHDEFYLPWRLAIQDALKRYPAKRMQPTNEWPSLNTLREHVSRECPRAWK